jgi:hypothetical protein
LELSFGISQRIPDFRARPGRRLPRAGASARHISTGRCEAPFAFLLPNAIIACGASYTEPLMANQALINLLDWCKRERENLQCQLDALKAGRFKTHSNDGSGWKDTTQDSIERLEENIVELSKLILRCEAGRRFDR